MKTTGIMMFNRGPNMLVRAMVTLFALRKHYDGNVTFYIEDPTPIEFDEAVKKFNCDVVRIESNHEMSTLVRKNSLLENPPYDKTLWLDSDMVPVGKIDKMLDYLDEKHVDFCIPSWCGWVSSGKTISKRLHRFDGLVDQKYMDKALDGYPSINTGIMAFRKSEKWSSFMSSVNALSKIGQENRIFIPDETAFGILYPSMDEWGLKYHICETDYNVSPLHDHGISKSPQNYHFHGDKHVLDVPACDVWKQIFNEMRDQNIANINYFVDHYADKRLKKYLSQDGDILSDVTVVTACDPKYVEFLRLTYPNWVEYKGIDKCPVIVFVNGIPLEDSRLDFLRRPNVRLIPWDMPEIEEHREKMLSAFVFGTAEHVKTEFWLKIDADSYATDDRPIISEDMKQYAFCGHKWSYSRPEMIKKLDEWAKGHWRGKLKFAKPMINEGKVDGRRFYHNTKRTISFIQLHKAKFTRFCVSLLREKRLPVPSQDTYMFFVCNRFDPQFVGVKNFKRDYGFTQGNSRLGVDALKARVDAVEKTRTTNLDPLDVISSDEQEKISQKEIVDMGTGGLHQYFIDSSNQQCFIREVKE